MLKFAMVFAFSLASMASSSAPAAPDYRIAADQLDNVIRERYAYLDKLPGGAIPSSRELDEARRVVHDSNSLLHYAEDRIASLADHHAITSASFSDSWAVIPTYADLWIVVENGHFVIDSVRSNSPASRAGIRPGSELVSVDGLAAAGAVNAFWGRMGLTVTPHRAAYAARVLAAGRRDRARSLAIADRSGTIRHLILPSLYQIQESTNSPITVSTMNGTTVVRFNNSLGDTETIAAFDDAMSKIIPGADLILDLRDTPSGGNTTVARAIMGWFVNSPHGYQVHSLPSEQRETGIARQWVEQVLPRSGKHHRKLPTVWVGRWTGSMGEGLAIGFSSMGAPVHGTRMAGLNGSIEDVALGDSGISVKLPTERLMNTAYQPREDFVPLPICDE